MNDAKQVIRWQWLLFVGPLAGLCLSAFLALDAYGSLAVARARPSSSMLQLAGMHDAAQTQANEFCSDNSVFCRRAYETLVRERELNQLVQFSADKDAARALLARFAAAFGCGALFLLLLIERVASRRTP